jgi:lysophospholipase L1-like esterase
MKPPLILPSLVLALLLPVATARCAPLKIACVGDSITVGMGNHKGWDYPAQLQRMLGAGYVVQNFGVSGTTMLHNGDRPYDRTKALPAALNSHSDITILMLGANDSKPQNWGAHQQEFEGDYRAMVARLQAASPSGKLFVCRPSWIPGDGNYGINEPVIEQQIAIIDKVAASLSLPEIDMNAALKGHPEDFFDKVHPNKAGSTLLAMAAYRAVTGADYTGTVPPPAP